MIDNISNKEEEELKELRHCIEPAGADKDPSNG